MKKFAITAGAITASAALIFSATPAFAVPDPWYLEGVTSGDLTPSLQANAAAVSHVAGWDAATTARTSSSLVHSTGSLSFSEDGTTWYNSWCDDLTAVVTQDAGATMVDCAAQIPKTGSPEVPMPGGIEVVTSFRLNPTSAEGIMLARTLFEVKNTSGAAITIPQVRTRTDYDVADGDDQIFGTAYTNNGPVEATADPAGTTMRWLNFALFAPDGTTVLEDYVTAGVAWASSDSTYFRTTSGDMASDVPVLDASSTDVVVPAGGSIFFAFYSVFANIPVGATDPDAIYNATTAYMAIFDGPYSGDLTVGLPEGITVLNWQGAPTLPDTGAGDMTGFAAGALAIVALGLGLVVARRRSA